MNYREDPENFSIHYHRTTKPRISEAIEKNSIKELKIEQKIVQNPNIPLRTYNYSYIKDLLLQKPGAISL